MPLHDLHCTVCDARFEWLTRAGEDPRCPSCDSAAVERLLSGFAVGGGGPRRTSAPVPLPAAPGG